MPIGLSRAVSLLPPGVWLVRISFDSTLLKLRVVLRIGLNSAGALRGPPILIEGTASPNGPALVAGVVNALRHCQPYSFPPPDKYAEWKILDLSFTPRDMEGG